jgi:hypothetical protein
MAGSPAMRWGKNPMLSDLALCEAVGNGNLSNGRMFPIIESFTGQPIDREYADTRIALQSGTPA